MLSQALVLFIYILVSGKLLNKQPRYMWFEALWLLWMILWCERFPQNVFFVMESIVHRWIPFIKARIRHCDDYFLVGLCQDVEQTIELPVIWDAREPYDFTVMKTQFAISKRSLVHADSCSLIKLRIVLNGWHFADDILSVFCSMDTFLFYFMCILYIYIYIYQLDKPN